MRLAKAVRVLLLTVVAVSSVTGQSTAAPYPDCLLVDTTARTIKSDADGEGDAPFIAQNCTATITCPDEQYIDLTFRGEARGTAYFLVKVFRVVLGFQLPNYMPAWNPHGQRYSLPSPLDTSVAIVQYQMMTPGDTDAVGGFEISWTCRSNCPSTLPTTIVPNATSNTVRYTVSDTLSSGSQPIVCTHTLEEPPCPAGMYVSYDFVKRPEYIQPQGYDPMWKLLWLQTPTPGNIIFPNSFNATEQYLVPAPVKIQVRAQAAWTPQQLAYEVRYYCLPRAMLPAAGMAAGVMDVLDRGYGVILSDADGEGPIPYPNANVRGDWQIICPYDTNVATTEISAVFGRNGNQRLTFTPILGTDTVFQDQINAYRNIPWGAPWLTASFTSPFNDNSGGGNGFTVKYECVEQCALGSPTRVSGPSPLSLKREWTALQPFADMCRWEVDTQCPAGEGVEVTMVKVPVVSETFKVVLDYDHSWFQFVWPDKPVGNTLFLAPGPFNASARAFNGTDAGFELRTSCIASTVCNTPWSQPTITASRGVVASDYDGLGPYPYDLHTEGGCSREIRCTGDASVKVDGALQPGDALEIEQLSSGNSEPSLWKSFTGSFDEPEQAVAGPLRVRLVAQPSAQLAASAPTPGGRSAPTAAPPTGRAGGFTVRFSCAATPSPRPSTTAGSPAATTLAPPPATTTVPPTPPPTPRPQPTAPGSNRTVTRSLSLSHDATRAPTGLAAAPDDDGDNTVIFAAIGGTIGGLLLCVLAVFVVLRAKNLTVREAAGMFFSDGTKYTKEFAIHGDDDIAALSGQRATNDMMANDDLENNNSINLLGNAVASPATAAANPPVHSRPTPGAANAANARPAIDADDI